MTVTNTRRKFEIFDPMLTDRQLWALGMIVFQWSALEKLIDQHVSAFLEDDTLAKFTETRSFSTRRRIWIEAIKSGLMEPHRSNYLKFASEIGDLQTQRDNYVHGVYGGKQEPHQSHRHAGTLRNISHVKGLGRPVPTAFSTMRDLALRIAQANQKLVFTEKELRERFGTSDLRIAFKHISHSKSK